PVRQRSAQTASGCARCDHYRAQPHRMSPTPHRVTSAAASAIGQTRSMTDSAGHTPPVTYEVAENVATITMNRSDSMNSLNLETKLALRDALNRAAADEQARCVVLTGSGKAFSAGQDLKEHVQ